MKRSTLLAAAAWLALSSALLAADPAKDRLTFSGSTAPGSTWITFKDNVYTFNYSGDESLAYQLDLNDPKVKGGMLRIREAASDSYPIDGGGFIFRDASSNFWFPDLTYKKTVMKGHSKSGKTVTIDYECQQNGNNPVRFTFTIEGKTLRIRAFDPAGNLNVANNFSGLFFGKSTGIDGCKPIHLQGALATPPILFRKPVAGGYQHYFTANLLDMFQSNASDYGIQDVFFPQKGYDWIWLNMDTIVQYKPMSNGKLAAPLDDSFVIVVSSKIKDVLATSTAPVSPYRHLVANRLFLDMPGKDWSQYDKAMDLFQTLGMYNLLGYCWGWSNGAIDPPASYNQGPDWFPPNDLNGFTKMIQKGVAYGYLLGAYNAYPAMPVTAPSWVYDPSHIARKANGDPKVSNSWGTPMMAVEASGIHAQREIGYLKDVGANTVYLDIQTYGTISKGSDGDHIDEQAGSPWSKTLRSGYAAQKKWLDQMRAILEGPIVGEGSIATFNTNMEFLWQGYVDSVQRCVNTGSGKGAQSLPAGSPYAPTNWPIIPEYEWRVGALKHVNHGNGNYDWFFGPSDGPEVVDMTTGAPKFPLSQKAMDIYQIYLVTYGHAGKILTNGVMNFNQGYVTHPGAVHSYFMSNALQALFYASPVISIRYLYKGQWETFEHVLFQSESTEPFRHIPVRMDFASGLRIIANHSANPLTITDQGATYTLPADTGWYAALPGLLRAFSAAPSTTSGKRIDYCWAAGQYEYFNGRGQVSGYGNISTSHKRIKYQVFPANLTVTEDAEGVLKSSFGPAPAWTHVQIYPETIDVKPGDRIGMKAIAFYSNGSVRDVTTLLNWHSTKKDIGTINDNGIVTALKQGTTKVVVTGPSGTVISAPATVVAAP